MVEYQYPFVMPEKQKNTFLNTEIECNSKQGKLYYFFKY